METLLLSDLLKIGIKYFQLDSTNTFIFNDGTMMWSHWSEWNNGEGSSGEDFDLVCLRDGVCYNVLDDTYKTLTHDERMKLGSLPYSRRRHPMSVWTIE